MEEVYISLKTLLKEFGMISPDSYDSLLKTSIMETINDGESNVNIHENGFVFDLKLVLSGKPDVIEELSDIFRFTYIGNIGNDIVLLIRKHKIHKNWLDSFIFWR